MIDASSNEPRPAPTFLTQIFFWPLIAASEAVAAQAGGLARLMTAACAEPDRPSKPD